MKGRGEMHTDWRIILLGFLMLLPFRPSFGQGAPYIYGSTPEDRNLILTESLSGNVVNSLFDVPDNSDVVVVGALDGIRSRDEKNLLVSMNCSGLRLTGKNREDIRGKVQAYKQAVDGGLRPFQNLNQTMNMLNCPTFYPTISTTQATKPEKRMDHPECIPQRLIHPPDVIETSDLAAQYPLGFSQFDAAGRLRLDIPFIRESARPEPSAMGVIAKLFNFLRDNPQFQVTIEGHTDNRPTTSGMSNQELSEQRARWIKDWLVSRGIAGDRIGIVGYGDSRPIADNGTVAGRTRNRRVEVAKR